MSVSPEIIAAQERLTGTVMQLEGVVGTGIGESDGELCIKVMVVQRTQELQRRIPDEYEGFKVVLQETGVIRKREIP